MLVLNYEINGQQKKMGLDIFYDPDIKLTQVFMFPDADVNKEPVVGDAYCHNNDQFNRRIGRKVAFRRAVDVYTGGNEHKLLGISRHPLSTQLRRALWAAFKQQVKL